MNNHELRLQNDLQALNAVHHFGWLRITELGILMKPHKASSLESGARLARSLIERRLVLARKLPEGAGQALVLATAGVRLLADYGIKATTGKHIGQMRAEHWTPPTTWKHDLLAHGVLCALHQRGYKIYPEAILRRVTAGRTGKLPDGLVRTPGEQGSWIWLEVEHSHKSGLHMEHLASAIVAVSKGEIELCGVHPRSAMVAYFADATDARAYKLNHRARVSQAVAMATPHEITITFVECTRKGAAGVGDVQLLPDTITPDRIGATLKRLNAVGWVYHADGTWQARLENYVAYVCEDTDEPGWWSYMVKRGEDESYADYARSMQDAKRCTAELIANPGHKMWERVLLPKG